MRGLRFIINPNASYYASKQKTYLSFNYQRSTFSRVRVEIHGRTTRIASIPRNTIQLNVFLACSGCCSGTLCGSLRRVSLQLAYAQPLRFGTVTKRMPGRGDARLHRTLGTCSARKLFFGYRKTAERQLSEHFSYMSGILYRTEETCF